MPVKVIVGGPVESVEVVLDGRSAGSLTAPSWSAEIDLGAEIVPHQLVARALGPDRHELARTRQWLNLPRAPAEVEILVERNAAGLATGGALSWESLTGETPKTVSARFNGVKLTVSKDRRIALPAYYPEQVQLLTVELEFANDVRARKDLVLGGRTGEQAETELSAVPIRVEAGAATPAPAALRGSLVSAEGPLEVAAVEDGQARLLIVRDSRGVRGLGQPNLQAFNTAFFRTDLSLDRETVVRFLWPRPAEYTTAGKTAELFPFSHPFGTSDGGLRWLLTRIVNPAPEPRPPKFADAVAVAGLDAYGSFRRRAVLLVLGNGTEDASQYRAEAVRRFLQVLRVPLFVWSTGDPTGPQRVWPGAVDVTSEARLREAFSRIKDELATQRIVWVEGRVLPQEVGLANDSGRIALVR